MHFNSYIQINRSLLLALQFLGESALQVLSWIFNRTNKKIAQSQSNKTEQVVMGSSGGRRGCYNTSVGNCKWLLNGSGRMAPWSQPLKCLDKTHTHIQITATKKEENIWMSRCGQPLSTRPGVWMKWNETTLISISHCRRRHLLSIRNAHLVCLLSFPTYRIISAGSTF